MTDQTTTDQTTADSWSIASLWACGGFGVLLEAGGLADCTAEQGAIRAGPYAVVRETADSIASFFVGGAASAIEGGGEGASSAGGTGISGLLAAVGLGAVAGAGVATLLGERPVAGALWGGGVGALVGGYGLARAALGW